MASRSDLCASKHMAALTDTWEAVAGGPVCVCVGGGGQTSLLYIPTEMRGVRGNHQHQVTGPEGGHRTELTEKASEAQRRETGEGGRPVLWGPWSPLGTGFQGGGRISWLDPPGNSHRRGDLIRAGPPGPTPLFPPCGSSAGTCHPVSKGLPGGGDAGRGSLPCGAGQSRPERGPKRARRCCTFPHASRSLGAPGFDGWN